jgi:hypothetical protein
MNQLDMSIRVAAAMREGLLAFSTAAGLVVMQQMLTADLAGIVGAKHAKLSEYSE